MSFDKDDQLERDGAYAPPLVSLAFRVDDPGPGHVRLSVWSGSGLHPPGEVDDDAFEGVHRARAGQLVLRVEEWETLRTFLDADPVNTVVGAPGPDADHGDVARVARLALSWYDVR